MQNLKRNKKGISLIFTFLLLILVFGSVSLSFLAARTNLTLNKRHTAELQVFNELESAKSAALWELGQAGNTWDTLASTTTVDSTARMPGASITSDFYSVSGHSFRVYVTNEDGIINIFIHAYKDRIGASAPYTYTYSKYAQYRYVPTPLYQYFIFANNNINFEGYDNLYKVKGGRIHSNKDITFRPYPSYSYGFRGIRFNQLTEMTAAGNMKYALRMHYNSPWSFDLTDRFDENNDTITNYSESLNATTGYRQGKAPAPYPANLGYSKHNFTTTNESVLPGPLMYYAPGSNNKYYPKVEELTGDPDDYWRWSVNQSVVNAPASWMGEDTMFYGKQYNGSLYMLLGYWGQTDNEREIWRMDASGNIGNGTPTSIVNYFDIDPTNTTLLNYTNSSGYFYSANVMFKPYKNNAGINNSATWIEIPGALPQTYKWVDKYTDTGTPVRFYETERCVTGYPGCIVEITNNTSNNKGWHYRKKLGASYCQAWNTTCYNNTNATYAPIDASTVVPYNGTTANYFDLILTDPRDRNYEFFDDYSYGDDVNDPSSPYRDIRAFSVLNQSAGFAIYQQKIASLGFDPNIIKAGVPKKYFDLGQLFDKSGSDSKYKIRARDQGGIYIDESNKNAVKDTLNTGNSGTPNYYNISNLVAFANWRTNQTINAIDINVGRFKGAIDNDATYPYRSFNGIIYTKIPIRLSNATILPGTNEGDRRAVFTVLSEESIYLKGDYNNPTNSTDWKLSHLATKKIIYGLTGGFKDRSYVDFWGYNGYEWNDGTTLKSYDVWPYVYLKLNATDKLLAEEGDPVSGDGMWINAYGEYTDVYDRYSTGGNPYGINYVIARFATNTTGFKQAAWQGKYPTWTPPNNITHYTNESMNYNSLFLTPYNFPTSLSVNYTPSSGPGSVVNTQFEDWYYNYAYDFWREGTVHINGSMINLYDTPGDPAGCCDDEYWNASGPTENPFNYRRNPSNYTAPSSDYLRAYTVHQPTVYQEYDDRLPDAVPKNYQAVLGMTGESVWRQITEDYFHNQTGG